MKRHLTFLLCALAMVAALPSTGCARRADKGLLPHTTYGGCRIQGRHYHNTHVFIGDRYEPSLSEWLKY